MAHETVAQAQERYAMSKLATTFNEVLVELAKLHEYIEKCGPLSDKLALQRLTFRAHVNHYHNMCAVHGVEPNPIEIPE